MRFFPKCGSVCGGPQWEVVWYVLYFLWYKG
jgi:hypothetical protein